MNEQPSFQKPDVKEAGRYIAAMIRKPWFLILVTGVVLVGVVGLSANKVMKVLLHSRPEVVVPDLEGKSLMEALRIVSEADLALRQDGTEFDEGLPAGTIVRQHPPAGIRVRGGRSIRVTVSKGGQIVFVPLVTGKLIAEAQSILAGEKLQLGAVNSIYAVDVKEGFVITQEPSSGTMVTRGALIDVQVSKGLPPAGAPLVPEFKGQVASEAQAWASALSAQVKVVEDPKATGVAGTIVAQDPLPGQPLVEGETLRITIVPMLAAGDEKFFYHVPPGVQGPVEVKILARDARGESEIYRGAHSAGDTVELPIAITSPTTIRVFLNNALQEERALDPR